ncbi:CHASE2 domain-containing protein [Pseudomonas sp. N040]|uniref:CHASE2 domain-containing protein n=1 Tax=Pseudomonas sp. N040 TaxID=2785325 RepID=UPI0018A2DF8F|nr:CHASE2 domain-containing protein [Pseudomonas sp. N040]MBF7728757.1 SpoIIE family protein phosphatase [Pseudomonas sp. N040]MBW7012397.1 SpoIIE family protein phosphatase [Pseudomonas sp. N040]
MPRLLQRLLAGSVQVGRIGQGRPAAAGVLLLALLGLGVADLAPLRSARLALFDHYQRMAPRQVQAQPVAIIEIDEATLGALGQWPWPRNYLAALIDAIAAHQPAAIGLDIIMPEADHASPQAVAESRPDLPEPVLQVLLDAASNDRLLSNSLASAPTVLGAAGFSFRTSATLDGLRTRVLNTPGENPLPWLKNYPYVLASLPEFQAAARGQALISSDPEDGIVRRMALLAAINHSVTPGLSLEMLRVASATPHLVVESGQHGVEAVRVGATRIPLQADGEAWVHFDQGSRQRYISALSLLKGEVAGPRIAGKLVLVGLTGLGLQDMITTPLGDRRPGVEAHAQLLESFADGHFLRRPWWMQGAELGLLLGAGAMLIALLPGQRRHRQHPPPGAGNAAQAAAAAGVEKRKRRRSSSPVRPQRFVLVTLLLALLLWGSGLALFRWSGLLFDGLNLFFGLAAVLASLFFSALIEYEQQRKEAESALQEQRLKGAKLAGELEAARRIQLGTLPVASELFGQEARFQIEAVLEPARQVGGDLYDFFMLDEQRLFFMIGDVSGKGLPASLFMLVTKALTKSTALRSSAGIGSIINQTNQEMARENPETLFVTAVAGILDVHSGSLELVNAGHDTPWLIDPRGGVRSISGAGGPPLGIMEDFDYPVIHLQLAMGETLLLFTDGITEAMDRDNQLYGLERVTTLLQRENRSNAPDSLAAALREDVRRFVGDTEASDDLTLLLVNWKGTGLCPA